MVIYIEFAWNYARFNPNYYFMKTTHILTPQSNARKLQKSQLVPYHGNSSMAMSLSSQTHSQSQADSHCDVTPVLRKQDPGAAGRAA